MRTDKITIYDLFEKQRRYLVPIFQRGYVWTKADQWEPLWLDLKDQAAAVQGQTNLPAPSVRKHFLGALVLAQIPMAVRQVAAFEVIDGQQRLLTLQIVLAAFRDISPGGQDEYLTSTLNRLTKNPGPFRDSDESYKVWPTNAHRDDFRNVLRSGSRDVLSNLYPQTLQRRRLIPLRPPLVEAYLYFSDKIDKYIRGIEEDDVRSDQPMPPQDLERAQALMEAMIRHVQLVAIELDNEDDPQVIFETLNSRGVPLEPSDLIRNFLFLSAARRGDNPEALYDTWWKEFDSKNVHGEIFWKKEERQGRLKRSRHDLFLFHYLTLRTAREHKITHVFQDFKTWWERGAPQRSMATELAAINRSSHDFKMLIAPQGTSRLDIFGSRLRILDTTTVYPLVLWMCENRQALPPAEFDGMLEDVESYLIRREVCQLTTKNYNRVFLNILSKLQSDGIPHRAGLRRELLSLEGESGVWPDDAQFLQRFIYEPAYRDLKPSKVRLILEALEGASQTSKQEALGLPASLSIEHVLPQGWEPENWPLPDTGVEDELRQRRYISLHSFGNLTLLTQPLNSAVSRGPFCGKRGEIALQSKLILNSYFQRLADDDLWNEQSIIKRGEELGSRVLTIWPRPSSTS